MSTDHTAIRRSTRVSKLAPTTLSNTTPSTNQNKKRNKKKQDYKNNKRQKFIPPIYNIPTPKTNKTHLFPTPRIITANMNSLSYYATTHDSITRSRKVTEILTTLMTQCDFLLLQETNLDTFETMALSSLFPGCHIHYNNLRKNVAGTLTVVGPKYNNPSYKIREIPLKGLKGYVQLTQICPESSDPHSHNPLFQIFNFYMKTGNDKITGQDKAARQFEQLTQLGDAISTKDLSQFSFAGGDFNFILHDKDTTSFSTDRQLSKDSLSLWSQFLLKTNMRDMDASFHTHFQICEKAIKSHSARYDRIYIPNHEAIWTIYDPRIELVQHKYNSNLYFSALDSTPSFCPRFKGEGGFEVTDHIPVKLTFKPKEKKTHIGTVPRWIADCPAFADRFHFYWDSVKNLTHRAFGRDDMFSKIVLKSVKHVIKLRLAYATKCTLVSAAIALYRQTQLALQNIPKIEGILKDHPHFLDYCYPLMDGRYVDDSLLLYLDELLCTYTGPAGTPAPINNNESDDDVPEDKATPYIKRSKYSLAKDLKALLPSDRRGIGGLRLSLDDNLTHDPLEKSKLAQLCYSAIWKKHDAEPARETLRRKLHNYQGRVESASIKTPTLEQIKKGILKTNNSCAGPNGIPFSIYRRLVDTYAPIALDIFRELGNGGSPPPSFNEGLLFLLPKTESGLVTDTRPLSVTNSNNRIIAAIAAKMIEPAVDRMIGPSQVGFIKGRLCDANICGLTNRYYEDVTLKRRSYILFLDVKKAFDQVHHQWIHEVLRRAAFPSWFRSLVHGLLHQVRVSPALGHTDRIWIPINRGVKQGCCLSPLLFILALDPLIRDLERQDLEVFAYADDMAIYMLKLTDIELASDIVKSYELYSGLYINGKKSGVLPSIEPTEVETEYLRALGLWKEYNSHLTFTTSTEYLGILIGASVSLDDIFAPTIAKALQRLASFHIVLQRLPLYKRVLVINIFINSLFSYKFRFYALPMETYDKIKEIIRIAITPLNGGAFPYTSLIFPTEQMGLKNVLKDLWAFNTSLLATRSVYIRAEGRYWDLPYAPQLISRAGRDDEKLIFRHRDAAAIDFWSFWRTKPADDQSSMLLSLPQKTPVKSVVISRILIQGRYDTVLTSNQLAQVGRRLSLDPAIVPEMTDEALKIIKLNLKAICKLPSHIAQHMMQRYTNSLTTSRRLKKALLKPPHLQDPLRQCYICDMPGSEDSLEHVVICPRVDEAHTKTFQLLGLPYTAEQVRIPPLCESIIPNSNQARPLYLSLLCFTVNNPKLQEAMARAMAIFNWAIWKGRHWSISHGMPLPDFVNRMAELCVTYTAPTLQAKPGVLPLYPQKIAGDKSGVKRKKPNHPRAPGLGVSLTTRPRVLISDHFTNINPPVHHPIANGRVFSIFRPALRLPSTSSLAVAATALGNSHERPTFSFSDVPYNIGLPSPTPLDTG